MPANPIFSVENPFIKYAEKCVAQISNKNSLQFKRPFLMTVGGNEFHHVYSVRVANIIQKEPPFPKKNGVPTFREVPPLALWDTNGGKFWNLPMLEITETH